MKKLIIYLAIIFSCCSAHAATVQGDGDSNGALDVAKGGTNATTAADARTNLGVPATASTLVGDCTVGPCLDGSTDGGNLIKLWAGTGSYWVALQGGAPAANRSWRLPIDAPPSAGETNVMTMDEYGQMGFLDKPSTSGYVLSSTDAGVLSWIANGSGGSMVYPGAGIPVSTGSAWGTSITLGTGVSTALGNAVNATGGLATYDSIPAITWGTGLTDTSNTIGVTYPVTAEAWSGSGWDGDTNGLQRNDAYDYLHIADTDDDGLPNKVDVGDGIPKVTSNVLGVATAGTDYSTPSSTDTLTNKTLDVEGTGNAITIVDKVWFTAAGCNNATATSFYDLPTSNPAAPACITGTNTQKGVLDFDAATDESAQVSLSLPSDWTGNIDLKYKWLAAATSGYVVWGVQTLCVADAETDDPSWNTASTVTDAAKGTTLQTNDASMTSITVTGCAAGELLHLRFYRDADNGSDDMSGDARLIGVELTMRRAQ